MLEAPSILDPSKVINLALAGFAWTFVLVESLSKRVDVPALKAQLNIRDAQVMAVVVDEIEVAILPHLPVSSQLFLESEDDDDGIEEIPEGIVIGLSETCKDALTRSLRKSEDNLHSMFKIRRLPRLIWRLNGCVFWSVFGVAVLASLGLALEYEIPHISSGVTTLSIVVPLCCAGVATMFAVLRHLKVQSAEENIIETNL